MGKLLLLVAGLAVASAGVVLLVWLLWHLWQRSEQDEETPAIEIGTEKGTPTPEPPVEEEPEAAEPQEDEEKAKPAAKDVKPDDLKKLEGIGPKISSVLQAGGIMTYAQLSDADVDTLKKILEDEDPRLLRLADPTSWPDQAALAASGEWDALKALQQELKGGRKN